MPTRFALEKPLAGVRGDFRRMIGISLVVHLILGAGFLWQREHRVYKRVSFPVMEVRMVSLPERAEAPPVPVPVPAPVRPSVKPAKAPAGVTPVRPLPADALPKGESTVKTESRETARVEAPPAFDEVPDRPVAEPVVAVDVRNFKYDYYLRLIQSKVERQWRQPVSGKERRAVVGFTISRKGRVEGVMIEESSGDDYFDQTALRAVRFSDPFPPLPQGYLGPSLQVHYRFQFGENG